MSSKETSFSDSTDDYIRKVLARFHSFDPGAPDEAVATLKAIDSQRVNFALQELLNGPDPDLRCDAAEALLRIDSEKNLDLIVPLLKDSIESVRWNTCGLLHDFGSSRAVPELIRVLLSDPESAVRGMAAWAIGAIGDESAIPVLRQVANTDNGTDRDGRRVSDFAMQAVDQIHEKK
jgi:HEAT repeat protein